jgi:5-methylcytosine-specific restriction endonuclease McrA
MNQACASRARSRHGSRLHGLDALVSEPWLCVGCANPTDRLLFCNALCAETARVVRYRRRIERDRRIRKPDVKAALAIREAYVLWGETPRPRLTEDQRAAVFASRGRLCEICGASATEIDHIVSAHLAGSELGNLRPLCSECHRAKTLDSPMPWDTQSPAAIASHERRREAYEARWRARPPLRACDEEELWPRSWATVARRRRDARRGRCCP